LENADRHLLHHLNAEKVPLDDDIYLHDSDYLEAGWGKEREVDRVGEDGHEDNRVRKDDSRTMALKMK
jgi:hypothetical protein